MSFELHPQLRADTFFVQALPLCDVLLMNDANYPWLILVPRVAGMRDVIDLDDGRQAVLMQEIALASRALKACFAPHKLNVAALGNMVAQLHVHVIARQEDDPAWPAPVWGRVPALAYSQARRDAVIAALKPQLGTA